MLKRFRSSKPDEKIKAKLLNRLRKAPNDELIRWVDNIHTGIGKNITEMRKSLTHGTSDQALIYTEDIKVGAVSLLAAMQVIEERLTKSL
jgi:hypothetical protein